MGNERDQIVAWLNSEADGRRRMSREKAYGLESRAKWEREAKLIVNLATRIRRGHHLPKAEA